VSEPEPEPVLEPAPDEVAPVSDFAGVGVETEFTNFDGPTGALPQFAATALNAPEPHPPTPATVLNRLTPPFSPVSFHDFQDLQAQENLVPVEYTHNDYAAAGSTSGFTDDGPTYSIVPDPFRIFTEPVDNFAGPLYTFTGPFEESFTAISGAGGTSEGLILQEGAESVCGRSPGYVNSPLKLLPQLPSSPDISVPQQRPQARKHQIVNRKITG